MNETDHLTGRAGTAGPGQDTRQWVTFGTVRPDTPDARSILFKDEQGNVLPWPKVLVEMHPSGEVAACRVANDCAGVGEGEWYPFVAGDEVLVVVPNGDERSGCVIIGRMNQTKDVWPAQVAGQDSTANNFGFRRMRAPYVLESADSILFRNATTNSFLAIDKTGNITATEGSSNGFLHVGADFIGMQTGDNSTLMQLDPTNKQVLLQADTAQFILDAKKSQFMTKGSLSIATGGAAASGHAVTLEQVCVLLASSIALVNTAYATTASPATALVLVTAAIASAAALPLGTMQAAIALGLQVPPDDSGTTPGIGRASLKI